MSLHLLSNSHFSPLKTQAFWPVDKDNKQVAFTIRAGTWTHHH